MPEVSHLRKASQKIYTIGHSNVSVRSFISLLSQFEVKAVVDVRSSPYSQFNPQFNREPFEKELKNADIEYFYSGDKLGGRPKDPTCYKNGLLPDPKSDFLHLVDYPAVMQKDFFLEGISRLTRLAVLQTTAIMCSEEDPAKCHRHYLISRFLMSLGVDVFHIRGDGKTFNAKQIIGSPTEPTSEQMELL